MNRRNIDIRNVDNDYIALIDLDFSWSSKQVQKVKKMWWKGYSISDISSSLKRESDEVFLLLMDLARKGEIKKRKKGIFGVMWSD